MNLLTELANVATGGLGSQIFDAVTKYFPPDMTPEQKANIQLAAENLELKRAQQVADAQQEAEKNLDARIAMYEGTASDLKSVPYLGALMLFLRGAQRPVWGFATMYLDFECFTGAVNITNNDMMIRILFVINLLVLGFLFGERALTNILPFIEAIVKAKNPIEKG